MTHLNRWRVHISGGLGGAGVTTFYSLDTTTFFASLTTLWTGLASGIPEDHNMVIDTFGDVIEDTTGKLVGAWDLHIANATIPGANGSTYAAPAGCTIQWNTSDILDGHRVRGRSFIVPLATSVYQMNGTLLDSTVTAFNGYAEAFLTDQSASFVVWHRPFAGSKPGVTPVKPAHDGGHALVTSSSVPDKVAILRSRRQ